MKKKRAIAVHISRENHDFIHTYKERHGFNSLETVADIMIDFCRKNEHALMEYFKHDIQVINNETNR